MRRLEPGFEKLILVCLNDRHDGRECCHARGSAEVHARLKAWVKEKGLSRKVRVSKSGCLDQCSQGTTVLVMPEFRWYGGVTLDDLDQFIADHLQHLVGPEAHSS
ncbi:MAG TPA: (2Fe-2S) ferredoxin domain-containing protein [Candidatus Polarisedimenticolia bacterium]|nr:(2Fe-2S) ferredoxin domain-containing protein [Candidatus Polarisedimenticolia bacterium]